MSSYSLLAGFLLTVCMTPAFGETAREILDEVTAVNKTREPKDVTQSLKMTNVRSDRVDFVRELETQTKFYSDESSKAITFFIAPADIKGVGYLVWINLHKAGVQWLYLPKLHRVRQIGPAMRGQSFQETVFTYEDIELFAKMSKWTESDATSRLLRSDESVDGVPCVLIEEVPKSAEVSYGRFLLWLHRGDATLRKSELYDRSDGSLAKTARFSDFVTLGRIPVARHIELANVKTDLRTIVEIFETRFDQGLDEEIFTPQYLERASR